jgi:hypothetical protein
MNDGFLYALVLPHMSQRYGRLGVMSKDVRRVLILRRIATIQDGQMHTVPNP